MTWSVKDITNYCRQLANQMNIEFDCPVSINGRLTRTHGRVIFYPLGIDKWTPEKLEISRQLLETATDESIMNIIKHEFVHWYIGKTTHEDHGHDALFQKVCGLLDCPFNTSAAKVERVVEDEAIYKYEVLCPNHGVVGKYHRAGKVVQHPHWYSCRACGHKLEVRQNW